VLLAGVLLFPQPGAAQSEPIRVEPVRLARKADRPPQVAAVDCGRIVQIPVEGVKTDCGYLVVPERRDRPGGPDIALPVVVVRAEPAELRGLPLLVLPGGPGDELVSGAPYLVSRGLRALAAGREVVFFGQRGTRQASPSLHCNELDQLNAAARAQHFTPAALRERAPEAYRACRARLEASGIDLSAYNSAESVADLLDLTETLGLDRMVLYGQSYGSRLALLLAQARPEGIQAMVLDDALPNQTDFLLERPRAADGAFRLLFQQCAADPECAAAYPDLELRFHWLLDRLAGEPLTVAVRDQAGRTRQLSLTGEQVAAALYAGLAVSAYLADVPLAIAAFEQGNGQPLQGLLESATTLNPGGLYFSIVCREYVGLWQPEQTSAARAGPRPELADLFGGFESLQQQCRSWGVPPAESNERQPIASEVPTLLLAGQNDPITPPAFAAEAARLLTRAQVLALPGVGHNALSGGGACTAQIAAAFLADPTGQLDLACLDSLGPPPFTGPYTAPR
jgi:pimeloyl-ACP methyl ester carboxylesterase